VLSACCLAPLHRFRLDEVGLSIICAFKHFIDLTVCSECEPDLQVYSAWSDQSGV
jgi:hypothetical protein